MNDFDSTWPTGVYCPLCDARLGSGSTEKARTQLLTWHEARAHHSNERGS